MPIYEYRCQQCGESFEKFIRSLSASAEVSCPSCGSIEIKRAISLFASGGRSSGQSLAAAGPACGPIG